MRKTKLSLVLAALVVSTGSAADLPDIKEGFWNVHTQTVDNPGAKKSEGTYSLCHDHAYDQAVRARAKNNMKNCTTVSESFQAGKYSVEVRCTVAGSVIETKGVTTFQNDSASHSETHTTYNPATYGVSESTITMDQKWVGSCPAGVQPGDRINSDGSVMHLGKK
jgi:cell division ATPase FtsA